MTVVIGTMRTAEFYRTETVIINNVKMMDHLWTVEDISKTLKAFLLLMWAGFF